MKDLKISVNKETRYVNLVKTTIGVDGENLQEKIVFSFEDEFVDGTARLEFENTDGKQYVLLEKENETYTIPVKSVITRKGNIKMQLVITEGTDEENIPVFKSNQFYLWCEEAINAVEEAKDSYLLWIETANEKLNEVDNLDIDLVEEDKKTKITITRKDGTTKETIIAGGDKGVSSYTQLEDLPTINGVELLRDKTTEDLGILEDVNNYIEEHKEELRGLPGEKGDKGDKGDTGEQGLPGQDGQPGKDGYTPVKGVDYFDGEQGPQGEPGPQGPQGIPGKDGVHGVVIYDTDDDEIIKAQLLSLVDGEYNLITPAFLISDYMMLFVLADVDTEDGKKQFRFKAGNLVNMEGQNMSYSVEILYRISDTGELEKDYATGMFYDNEAIMQNVNDAIDEKITGALGGDY